MVGLAFIARYLSMISKYLAERELSDKRRALKSLFLERHSSKQEPHVLATSFKFLLGIFTIVFTIATGAVSYYLLMDGMNVVDSVYLATMIVSTVGYGDITPKTRSARVFTIFYAILGTVATAKGLSMINQAISKRVLIEKGHALFNRRIDSEMFSTMNASHKNIVTQEEFVLYSLTRLGLIDKDIRHLAELQFHKMDTNKDGNLTMEEVRRYWDLRLPS
jgi:hypothetical protein